MSNLEVVVLGSLAIIIVAGPIILAIAQYTQKSRSTMKLKNSGEKNYDFNPATGLPMMGPLDLDGNLWGTSGRRRY
jgi:hypothetical protein